MMSRKHYQKLADIMYQAQEVQIPHGDEFTRHFVLGFLDNALRGFLKEDNPNFDPKKFENWCLNGTDKKS